MIAALVVTVVIALMTFIAFFAVISMVGMAFMEDFRFLPVMTLAGNSSEKKSDGNEVKRFHRRRV